jgi:hypothetical protein
MRINIPDQPYASGLISYQYSPRVTAYLQYGMDEAKTRQGVSPKIDLDDRMHRKEMKVTSL